MGMRKSLIKIGKIQHGNRVWMRPVDIKIPPLTNMRVSVLQPQGSSFFILNARRTMKFEWVYELKRRQTSRLNRLADDEMFWPPQFGTVLAIEP